MALRPLLSKARIPNTFENNQILVSSALDFKEKIESLLKDLSKVDEALALVEKEVLSKL